MSPSHTSSDDFPRLIGADNFDVWKTRVCAALDGKHLLGFAIKPDYDGISEDDNEDSGNEMTDNDDPPKTTSAKTAEVDSDTVDYDGTTTTSSPPLSSRSQDQGVYDETMDNTHVRLVKNLVTSYDIFSFICEKYEGAAFHGEPYFFQHYLMEIKYDEGSDVTEFFLKCENATTAASEATESVMTEGQKSTYLFHSMPKSWKDDLRMWKGQRKYIPYVELKQSIEGKVRDLQAQERYTLETGTPDTAATKSERALVATDPASKGKLKRNGNGAGGNYNGNRCKNWQRQNYQDSSDDGDYHRGKSR
ncbi:unnamed protein product [Phytophthora fragariaefolia]|uniref:Unnamed protein product n=1 Tax=Phytophthora fragariaefolia TaxID=1490495 RepID=A0A9W6WR06_9STRA|nr:unnamed protein product [Phytophthora fragariaefolia]